MRHLDLFSGIGGFALAASWVWEEEHELVGFCEIDKYCQQVLRKHWPDVPIYDDVRDIHGVTTDTTIKRLYNKENEQIMEGKRSNKLHTIKSRDIPDGNNGITRGTIDLITGGFPCQPFSQAGKRRGKEDDRHLWPEYLRIIQEVRPRWVLGENVAGIINMELDQVLSDLEGENYSCQSVVIPACSVNAVHRRDRVWIIAHSNEPRENPDTRADIGSQGEVRRSEKSNVFTRRYEHLDSHTKQQRLEGARNFDGDNITMYDRRKDWEENWVEVATLLCRVDDGVSRRVDRLKALGNAIVPQVAYEIFKYMKECDE